MPNGLAQRLAKRSEASRLERVVGRHSIDWQKTGDSQYGKHLIPDVCVVH